jgi:hypothetical protein
VHLNPQDHKETKGLKVLKDLVKVLKEPKELKVQ